MADPEKIEKEAPTRPEKRTASPTNTIADRLQAAVSPDVKEKIQSILDQVSDFSDLEKLLLYLKLPAGALDGATKHKHATPMAAARAEQTHAFNWIRSHLEESTETSLPKHEVFEDYRVYCENSSLHVLSPADFGKIMKCMFPNVKGRRLGTRGNSRYCYSGIRKKTDVKPPVLPTLNSQQKSTCSDLLSPSLCWKCQNSPEEEQVDLAMSLVVCEWATKIFTKQFSSILDVADHLTQNNYVAKSMAALTVISYMAERNRKAGVDGSVCKLTQSVEERHRETKNQLQRKIQHSQLVKMRQQQEHRKKLQSRLATDSRPVVRDRTKFSQGVGSERSHSVPADRLFSDMDSNSGGEGASGDSKDNCQSSQSESASTSWSYQGAASQPAIHSGVKDSPNKRRYTPIQPKTPVRDKTTIKAVPFNIQGLPKGQPSQFFLLKNPNGTAHLATEVVGQNGQKMLQLVDGGAAQMIPQTVSANKTSSVVSSNGSTTPVTTKPVSQIVLVSPAPNTNISQGVNTGVQTISHTSKTETIANAALLVSPSTHVLVSPVKTNSHKTKLVSASVAQIVSNSGGHVVVQSAPMHTTQVKTFSTGIVSPPSQTDNHTQMTASIMSPSAAVNVTSSNSFGVPIKKEGLSSGPTAPVESLGCLTATTASVTYVRAIVRSASPKTVVQQNGGSTSVLDSISTRSTPICLPGMISTIPHRGSAAALLQSLSSTVNSNLAIHTQANSVKLQPAPQKGVLPGPMQIQMRRSIPSQTLQVVQNKTLLKQRHASAPAKAPTEILDATANQLQQVAATLQLQQQQQQFLQQQHQQVLLQQQQTQNNLSNSGTPGSILLHNANQIPGSTGSMSMLQTALMSPLSSSSNTANSSHTQGILSTSEAMAKLNALQLHDNHIAGTQITLQGNQLGVAIPSSVPGMMSVDMTPADKQQPGFIPVAGVKRFAVDPISTATVLTKGTAFSVDGIQQQLCQQQQQQLHNITGTTLVNNAGTSQCLTTTNGSTAYQVNVVTSGDTTFGIIPISQLSQIVTSSQQAANQSRSASVASICCTPTSNMQSPIPMALTINGHVTPILQQTSGTSTPILMSTGSVPPSPVDGSSFFTPIHQQGIDQSQVISNASPLKRTQKVKPRATHPKQTSIAEFTSQQGIQQQGNFQHVEIASKPNFATPTRKRRSSGQRRVNANPYPAPLTGPRQTTPVASPCGSRCSTPVSPATPNPNLGSSSQADSISMPPPSPGLPPFDNAVMGASRQNRSTSPALWNNASARRRNPSGPPTYTMQQLNRQHSLESSANTYNQTDLNNVNQVFIDHNGRPTRLPSVSKRSQSVPLPELPEARILNFQLQQIPGAIQTSTDNNPSEVIVTQDKLLASLNGTELRGIQANTASNYNAKRNLTLELQEIEVTEDDFVVGLTQSSPDGNSQPATGLDAFNELLNSNGQPSDQGQEIGQGSSWTSSTGDPTLGSAPTAQGASDLNVGFDMGTSSVGTPGTSGLPEDQSLLFTQAMNGEASNSTSSTLNDDMTSMEDPLSDFGSGPGFDLSWQMGSNNSLSTLECGM